MTLPLRTGMTVLLSMAVGSAVQAQDTRRITEPRFPPTCAVIPALLGSTTDGPVIGPTLSEQDSISAAHTALISAAIDTCPAGSAVRLSLGLDSQHNAFLINPLVLPPGVSLVIDGGVTVYASRNPANYQLSNSQELLCGTLASRVSFPICRPVLTFLGDSNGVANSGLYGYGVLDGQGQMPLLTASGSGAPASWWDLINEKDNDPNKATSNVASPFMVLAGNTQDGSLAGNFTMYKITVRNPPFHAIDWGGDGLTVWGVHVQAPWNVPNTDGFDLHGSNMTLFDTSVSNGDDDIAFDTNQSDTANITVDHFSTYARDGITLLGNSTGKYSMNHLLIENITMSADLPSVVTTTANGASTTTVNGLTEDTLKQVYNVTGFAQALPNAISDVNGINIKYTDNSGASTGGAIFTDITFRNVCIHDVLKPLNIIPQSALSGRIPTVTSVVYNNIRILAPSDQFLSYRNHNPGPSASGRYQVNFLGGAPSFRPQFTLSNVVIDDLRDGSGSSLTSLTAEGNALTTRYNVYPSAFTELYSPPLATPRAFSVGNTFVTVNDNYYLRQTSLSSPQLGIPCRTTPPFLSGELYASLSSGRDGAEQISPDVFTTRVGSAVTLNAIVQPIMSQTTYASKGSTPAANTVAVGSPRLTNPVRFFDGFTLVGFGTLSANGTLATLKITHLSRGFHLFTAQYPSDSFYSSLNFGSVAVYAGSR